MEQGVEPPGCGRSFGQEDIVTVELRHVLDPMGVKDGIAARDRQGMEDTGWTLTVLPQGCEEGGLVALEYTISDAHVQVDVVLLAVEDPAKVSVDAARDLFNPGVDKQIQIQFRY